MKQLKINTALQISRPVSEVYEAIIDPQKMSGYFISEGSGRMEEGKRLTWKFYEFSEEAPVEVVEITPLEYISFQWEGAKGKKMLVEITLLSMPGDTTLVKVTEEGMNPDEAGIKWLAQNTEGWANFLASLKAYLEYGINLRKGAFDFLKEASNG